MGLGNEESRSILYRGSYHRHSNPADWVFLLQQNRGHNPALPKVTSTNGDKTGIRALERGTARAGRTQTLSVKNWINERCRTTRLYG